MAEQNLKNHPGIAAVLSFVFNGLGQLYNGQITKGLILISISAVNIVVLIVGSVFMGSWFLNNIVFAGQLVWGLVLLLLAIASVSILGTYSIIDAYNVAKKST